MLSRRSPSKPEFHSDPMSAADMAERLRIVLFAPHFAEYSARLALALSASCDVLLIVEQHNLANECGPSLLAHLRDKVTVDTFKALNRSVLGQVANAVRLPLRIRRFKPDLIHFQEQGDKLTATMLETLSLRHSVVLTVHDPRPHSGEDTSFALKAKPFLDRMRDATHGFHVHGAVCERLLRTVCRVDVPVLSTPHGVLLVPDQTTTRPRRPAGVLFFGRMEAYKGLDVLLDAVDELQRRGCPLDLTIAGRGPELRRAADRIARMSGIRVVDRFLTPAEATVLFQETSIVTAPYRDATQSGIVAAAFGNGRPVVASRVGGLVDAVSDGETGILVPPNDPIALADALGSLLTDDLKAAALRQGARERAATHLDWSNIAQSLEAFYREVVTRTTPPADRIRRSTKAAARASTPHPAGTRPNAETI